MLANIRKEGQNRNNSSPANTVVWMEFPCYISDEGETCIEADSPPGPTLPANVDPVFRFVVTNVGNVTLTDIEVVDDVLGLIANIDSLEPDESEIVETI